MSDVGKADLAVRIVGSVAQADQSVFVVNQKVVAGTPVAGDAPVVQADGSLAWALILAKATADATYAPAGVQRKVRYPALAQRVPTYANASGNPPCWMSQDGRYLFNCDGPALRYSIDDGVTWTLLNTFTLSVHGVRDLADGELLVSLTADGTTTAGQVWKSSGWAAGPTATPTWTKVLDASGVGNSIHSEWGMSSYRNIVVLSEYGSKVAGTNARYVWKSTDYGATYAIVYDNGLADSAHVHGSFYDPWWDAIWVTTGDFVDLTHVNRSIRLSLDGGTTWTLVNNTNQVTTVIPMESAIVFCSDSVPNGVWNILRDDTSLTLTAALSIDAGVTIGYAGGMPFRAKLPGAPVILPFHVDSGTGKAAVAVATFDGLTFAEIYRDAHTYTTVGLRRLVGPTRSGNLVGDLRDDRNAITRLTIPFPYSWDTQYAQRIEIAHGTPLQAGAAAGLMGPTSGAYFAPPCAVSANSRAAGNAYACPLYVSKAMTLTKIGIEITASGASGALIRLGLYADNGVGRPGALLIDAGTIDGTQAAGFYELACAITLAPGLYWTVGVNQAQAVTVRTNAGGLYPLNDTVALNVSANAYSAFVMVNVTGALVSPFVVGSSSTAGHRVLVKT